MDRECLSRKRPIEKVKKKEINKEKNTDTTQTKLNAPNFRYNVKVLPQ